MSSDILTGLNQPQTEAVTQLAGPLLILAGAGSGKTRVLTSRIAWAIETGFVSPYEVFAVTFTNKAAAEMRERAARLAGRSFDRLWVKTFHSACAQLLRIEHLAAGLPPGFGIFDQSDQLALIKELIKRHGFDLDPRQAGRWLNPIQRAKDWMIEPKDFDPEYGDRGEVIKALYQVYNQALQEAGVVDFGDLINLTVKLFRNEPEIREKYSSRFKLILVDEFQDTNLAQYELISLLARVHQNISVVGDDDQSIYSWRGACVENFSSFAKDFAPVKIVKLEQNYRSTQAILRVAAGVIAKNLKRMPKEVWSAIEEGPKPQLKSFDRDREEADWIAQRIADLQLEGVDLNQVAIFYRANWQSRALEDSLRTLAIPHRLIGSLKFYDRREIKDCLAWLKLALNPRDPISFRRALKVPPRRIGERSIEKLIGESLASGRDLLTTAGETQVLKQKSQRSALKDFVSVLEGFREGEERLSLRVANLLEASGLKEYHDEDERIENLEAFLNSIYVWEEHNPEGSAVDYLTELALIQEIDRTPAESGSAVNLMTVHNSKGLEFDQVFLTGLEEELFPHHRSLNHELKLEEERRLFYVAVTRARERLVFTYSLTRFAFGELETYLPSRFLSEIEPDLIEGRLAGQSSRATKSEFFPGQRIRHRDYGEGVILERSGQGKLIRLRVAFGERVLTLLELYSGLESVE